MRPFLPLLAVCALAFIVAAAGMFSRIRRSCHLRALNWGIRLMTSRVSTRLRMHSWLFAYVVFKAA